MNEWQRTWPHEEGAWWFYGVMRGELKKDLFVMIVHKTADVEPKYFAFRNGRMYFEGEIEGWWQRIETPVLPEGE